MGGCARDPISNIEQIEIQRDISTERADALLDQIPEWYIAPPPSDGTGLYAAGTGFSQSLESAVAKSGLEAEYNLASIYNQHVSGQQSKYEKEVGQAGEMVSHSERVIDKFVNQVNLAGYTVKDKRILREDIGFRVFTLLYYPFDSFNQVKQQIEMKVTQGHVEGASASAKADLLKRVKSTNE